MNSEESLLMFSDSLKSEIERFNKIIECAGLTCSIKFDYMLNGIGVEHVVAFRLTINPKCEMGGLPDPGTIMYQQTMTGRDLPFMLKSIISEINEAAKRKIQECHDEIAKAKDVIEIVNSDGTPITNKRTIRPVKYEEEERAI